MNVATLTKNMGDKLQHRDERDIVIRRKPDETSEGNFENILLWGLSIHIFSTVFKFHYHPCEEIKRIVVLKFQSSRSLFASKSWGL